MTLPAHFEPGWIDCGCCAGISWGGEYPTECYSCKGGGMLWRYASGRLALWPGGPFAGQEHPDFKRSLFDFEKATADAA